MYIYLVSLINMLNNTRLIVEVIAVAGIFIEITPIKINPISMLLNWIGERLTHDINKKLEEYKNDTNSQLEQIKKEQEEIKLQNAIDEVDKIRTEVLQFGRSCRNHEKHTQSQFKQIFSLYKKYTGLVELYSIENGMLEMEYEYIKKIYSKCQMENSFIEED